VCRENLARLEWFSEGKGRVRLLLLLLWHGMLLDARVVARRLGVERGTLGAAAEALGAAEGRGEDSVAPTLR
jgi:hypothetical protein